MEDQIKNILTQLREHEKRISFLEDGKESKKNNDNNDESASVEKNITLFIVNKIGKCDESALIREKVLDQKKVDAKVLVCFYIAYKYFDKAWLTSGDIERITSEMGIKITTGNASNKIKKMRAYLESGAVRRKGAPTPYRLNRNGVNHFESIINGK